MISKLDFVGIPSQDAERSRSFYVDTLGLRPDDHAQFEVWAGEPQLRHLGAEVVRHGVRRAEERPPGAPRRRPTADALADAFRRFDADAVARRGRAHRRERHVLRRRGPQGDARATRRARQRVEPDGDGPVGPTRMLLGKPVIAAVEGHAVAGGLELAVWCDLRVAAEDAVFGVYCRRWGIPLMDGGTIRLARLIGHSHALDLILTGRGVSGEEALRMGLANRLVPPGGRSPRPSLAQEMAARPQAALRSDRLSSYEQWSLTLDEALANEYRHGWGPPGCGFFRVVGVFPPR